MITLFIFNKMLAKYPSLKDHSLSFILSIKIEMFHKKLVSLAFNSITQVLCLMTNVTLQYEVEVLYTFFLFCIQRNDLKN